MEDTKEVSGVSFDTLIKVWAALVILTGALWALSRVSRGWAVTGLLTITPLKVGLVCYFFMRLRYERPLLKGMVFMAFATLVTFLGLLFSDIPFR